MTAIASLIARYLSLSLPLCGNEDGKDGNEDGKKEAQEATDAKAASADKTKQQSMCAELVLERRTLLLGLRDTDPAHRRRYDCLLAAEGVEAEAATAVTE